MASTDHLFSFPEKFRDHRCPACEALYRDTEELARKVETAEAYAKAMKQEALVQEAERDRLLRLLFSSGPGEA